jgi:Tol biopolymer transport system component
MVNKDTEGFHLARTDINTGSTSTLIDDSLAGWPVCTADGSTLIYVTEADHNHRCSLMSKSLTSGGLVKVHEFDHSDPVYPTISPDGKKLLFLIESDSAAAPMEWAMMPVSGGSIQKIQMPLAAGEVVPFKWGPDSKSILYARDENGVGNIWSVPLAGGPPKKLTDFRSDEIFSFDVSQDNRVVVSRGRYTSDLVLLENVK